MSSLVLDFQKDLLRSHKTVVENLRTARLISAKLGLSEISEWIECELNGYPDGQSVPEYRVIRGGTLQVLNPYRGWQNAGEVSSFVVRTDQPISELEEISKGEFLTVTPNPRLPVRTLGGSEGFAQQFQQRLVNPPVRVKTILETVKNKLLDWSLELEKRGILGNDMSFNSEEKRSAKTQIFNIEHLHGVAGNVTDSSVTVYDYGSVYKATKEAGVPKPERDELEKLMDDFKEADPIKKRTLTEKAKAWLVRNQDILGASAGIVRHALGLGEGK